MSRSENKTEVFQRHTRTTSWDRIAKKRIDNITDSEIVRKFTDFVVCEDLPNWRDLIKSGQDATTGLTGVRTTYGGGTVSMTLTYPISGSDPIAAEHHHTRRIVCDPVISAASSITSGNQAYGRLQAKILQSTQQMNAMVTLGELAETINMLKSPLSSLRNGYWDYINNVQRQMKGLKTSKRFSANAVKDTITGTYLEAVMAWRPLINDINQMARAIGRINEKRTALRFTGKGIDEKASTSSKFEQATGTNIHFVVNEFHLARHSTTYVVAFKPEFLGNTRHNVGALFGFVPENFIPTAYALLPYSWLLDYFVNVGQLISSVCSPSYAPWYAFKTTESIQGLTLEYAPRTEYILAHNNGVKISGGNGATYSQIRKVSRSKLTGMPAPTLEFKIPNSLSQVLNIGALVLQGKAVSTMIKGKRG